MVNTDSFSTNWKSAGFSHSLLTDTLVLQQRTLTGAEASDLSVIIAEQDVGGQ